MFASRWLIAVSAALWISSAVSEPFVQSNESFAAALDNRSTSPSFILLTVVDDRTQAVRNGCTLAPFLIGAIMREYRLESTKPKTRFALSDAEVTARRIALAAPNHFFHFSRPEALANLPFDYPDFDEACRLIRAGFDAYMPDRGGPGRIVKGRPSIATRPPRKESK